MSFLDSEMIRIRHILREQVKLAGMPEHFLEYIKDVLDNNHNASDIDVIYKIVGFAFIFASSEHFNRYNPRLFDYMTIKYD